MSLDKHKSLESNITASETDTDQKVINNLVSEGPIEKKNWVARSITHLSRLIA